MQYLLWGNTEQLSPTELLSSSPGYPEYNPSLVRVVWQDEISSSFHEESGARFSCASAHAFPKFRRSGVFLHVRDPTRAGPKELENKQTKKP